MMRLIVSGLAVAACAVGLVLVGVGLYALLFRPPESGEVKTYLIFIKLDSPNSAIFLMQIGTVLFLVGFFFAWLLS